MQRVTKDKFASNTLWKFTEIIIRKSIALVISTILARLLTPEAYGIVALTTIFIAFSDIFILSGFNVAIIRKKYVDEEDYSTVMIISLVFSTIVYLIIYFIAPIASDYFSSPELKNVLRVITLLIFFQSISTVVRAKATRDLKFKEMSFVAIWGNGAASLIGLVMAYDGYEVWALVAQQVFANFFDMVFLLAVFKWRFKWCFSISKAKEMLRFAFGVLGSSLLDFIGNNASALVVGRVFNTSEIGIMNRGNMYPETICLNMYNSINSVLLPTLSSRQNNIDDLKKVVRKVVSLTEYIILPLMIGLIAISDRFVSVLLTYKWDACIPIMICACLYYSINPIRSIEYTLFYAKGESERNLKIESIRFVAMIINLLVTIIVLRQSIYMLFYVNVIIAIGIVVFTHVQAYKCVGYKVSELIRDLYPSLVMSIIMGIAIKYISFITKESIFMLVVQSLMGVFIYCFLSMISRNNNYVFIKEYILGKLHWRRAGDE